jgi:predicted NBD/HSP70 family sugar kinase
MKRSLKFSKTASPKLQYKINTSIIFNYLRENGPISRAKISRDLGISAPAVSRVVDKLIKDGYVIETEKLKTAGGKRPTLLEINSGRGYVLGIDLGRERMRAALANFNGKIVKKHLGFKILDSKDMESALINEIGKILSSNKESRQKLKAPELKAICIAVPADVDTNSGKIISAPLYGNWRDLNLKDSITNEFNIPVFIDNNVNLATLAEKNYGEGMSFTDVVFVEISNGIAAGIIIDNHLLRGSYGSAGEIGFTIINSENLGFKVRNKGFLEKFASVRSIKKKAIEAISKGKKTSIVDIVKNDIDNVEPSMVCRAAIAGDVLATEIIEETVKFLSIAIINLILILNPQIIILGGDICNLPEVNKLFVKPIMNLVEKAVPFKIPYIRLSLLGEDSGIVGASMMAMESVLMGEFPYKIEQEVLS